MTTTTRPSLLEVRASRSSWTTAAAIVLLLALVLPVGVARAGVGDLAELEVVLAWAITAYAAIRLASLYVRGEPRIVELGFYLFVYLWMGLAPLAQVTADRFPLGQEFEERTQVAALVTVVLALVAYEVGRVLARTGTFGIRMPALVERARVSPARTWMLAAFGLVCTAAITITSGGLGVRFSSRVESERALFDGLEPGLRVDQAADKAFALVKGALMVWPVFFALLLLLYLRRCARDAGVTDRLITSRAATLLVAVLVVGNVVANNPIVNSRLRSGIVLFALAAVLVPPTTAKRFRVALVGVGLIFLVVFPYADVFRYRTAIVDVAPLSEELVTSPDYAMFNQDMNAVVFVEDNGFQDGRQALGSAASLVPRRLWGDKPIATGDLISRRESDINASSTLWSEAYVDGGRLGVLLVLGGWGVVSQLLSDAYVRRPRGVPELVGVIVPIFAGFQIFIVRGALQPTMADLWPLLVMTLFCIPLAFGSRRSEEPVPQARSADGDGG